MPMTLHSSCSPETYEINSQITRLTSKKKRKETWVRISNWSSLNSLYEFESVTVQFQWALVVRIISRVPRCSLKSIRLSLLPRYKGQRHHSCRFCASTLNCVTLWLLWTLKRNDEEKWTWTSSVITLLCCERTLPVINYACHNFWPHAIMSSGIARVSQSWCGPKSWKNIM